MKVYVVIREDVTYQDEKYIFVYDVYDDYDNCYTSFKELIERFAKENNMFVKDFKDGDVAFRLYPSNDIVNYEDEYCTFYIVERELIK